MKFLAYLFLLLLSVVLLLGCSKEKTNIQYSEHQFTANVADVRLSAELLKQGNRKEDKVSLLYPAFLLNPPLYSKDVREFKQKVSGEVAFVLEYIKANIQGDKEKIYEALTPTYRKQMQSLLDDESIFRHNCEIFEKNPEITIYGQIKQGDDVSVLVKYGPYDFVVAITLVKIEGKFYITDKPTNDLDLAIVEASFF